MAEADVIAADEGSVEAVVVVADDADLDVALEDDVWVCVKDSPIMVTV